MACAGQLITSKEKIVGEYKFCIVPEVQGLVVALTIKRMLLALGSVSSRSGILQHRDPVTRQWEVSESF